jgi:D-sedoheptulose 7-phosphate isomerase
MNSVHTTEAEAAQSLRSKLAATLEGQRRRTIELLEQVDIAAVIAVAQHLIESWKRGALVVIAGNGGSASTASHMANDLVKATRVESRRPFRAISLTDNVSLLTAFANDEGYETVFASQLEAVMTRGDVLVLISASGNSPNAVAAAARATELGASTVALVGFDGGALARTCDLVIRVDSEPGEYGSVEDVHLVLNHMISEALRDGIGGVSTSTGRDE